MFNAKAIEHLAEIEWDPAPLLSERRMSSFAVPPIYSTEGAQMLNSTGRLLSLFPHRIRQIHRLYTRLAESALEAEGPSSSSQGTTLHRLVRQLWHTAPSSRGNVEGSARELLCAVVIKAWEPTVGTLLRTILSDASKAEQHIRRLVEQASRNSGSLEAAEHVLGCIPEDRLSAWVPSITATLAKAVSKSSRNSKEAYIHQMEIWLRLVHHVDVESKVRDLSLLDNVIASLARHIFARRDPCHFQARTILTALILKTFQPSDLEHVTVTQMSQIVQFDDNQFSLVDALGSFMSRMRNAYLPYRPLAEALIDVVASHANLALVLQLMNIMDARRLTVSDTHTLKAVIAGRIAFVRNAGDRLTAIQQEHNAFALRTCQRILEVLLRISATTTTATTHSDALSVLDDLQSRRQFQHILDRAADCHALPLAYRNVSADLAAEQRVDLIHQMAHQHSTDNTRSCREAGRAIYYLYRYLRQNSFSIGPLFTKAVVRVYIVRPLSENRFVSARRLIWVCHLVADVEGEDVAKKIESAFWDWRGDLIKHTKSVYVAVGGDRGSKAHVGTMKRLGLI
jgi:hypothetical protein